ncbi:MAG: hypothetical protein V2I35_14515, partial [Desulfocapsaceae bacterium]|nr:hypothetical protein [Desulfocapsaceae bacterium]
FTLLLEKSPKYRGVFLSLLVEVLNHSLTEEFLFSRLDYYQQMLTELDEPHEKYFDMLRKFMANRSHFLLEEIQEALQLSGPFDFTLSIPSDAEVLVDGHKYSRNYEGHYFTSTAVELQIPEDKKNKFSHWLLNGKKETGIRLQIELTKATQVSAVFENSIRYQ